MMQQPPGAVPPEVFCVAGWTLKPVLEHEEFLLQQHEAGAVQLYDRGQIAGDGPPLRRWRLSWSRGGETIYAVVAMIDLPENQDCIKVWVAAHSDLGWGWDVPSPLNRLGLNHHLIADPLNGLASTGSTSFDADEPLEQVLAVARDRRMHIPVLVHHIGPEGMVRWASPFRFATFGAVSMVFVDDDAARRLSAELPPENGIPERGARLFFPPWWGDRLADIGLARDHLDNEQAWRSLVDVALQASRWRAEGPMAVDEDLWRALFAGAWNDERVAEPAGGGTARWYTVQDDVNKSDLRQRIQGMGDNAAELRGVVSDRASAAARLDTEIDQNRMELTSLTRSRRTLTYGVLRLRAERDAARTALARTSVGAALHAANSAKHLARARAAELQEREDELDRLRRKEKWLRSQLAEQGRGAAVAGSGAGFDTFADVLSAARELTGVSLGAGVSDQEPVTGIRLQRCWTVLAALDSYAAAPDEGTAAEYLRSTGISASLLDWSSATPAVTFPVSQQVDPSGWAPFSASVSLDHASRIPCSVHYLDDTAGPTGLVHVGYVGAVPS